MGDFLEGFVGEFAHCRFVVSQCIVETHLIISQAELLAPFALRYLDELHTLKGGLLNQGLTIRAMYPLGAGDEEFLAAAEAAADDTSLMAYARNQLRSNSFVLGRILAARRL